MDKVVRTAQDFSWYWSLCLHLVLFLSLCERLGLAAAQLSSNSSSTATDLQALEGFKNSFSSASLTPILADWTGTTFCNWSGVTCNNESRVYNLILPSNGLTGKIPPSLENLTSLHHLDLSSNSISGDIPAFIGNYNDLIHLDLHGNFLNGSIPPTAWNLSSLQHLDLSENALSGSIPTSICALSPAALGFLSLAANRISGSIPDGLNRCLNLTGLYLGLNMLSGRIPDSFQSLVILETLDLSFNNLEGPIPRLPNGLRTLALKKNRLTGNISTQEGNLPDSLELLSLSSNGFWAGIPEELGKLRKLQKLELNENSFQGSVPDTWQQSSPLQTLDLSVNNLSGVIPSSIANLTGLTILQLDRNSLSGSIPASIGNLSNLTIINLAENGLSGEIPAVIGDLLQVITLNLSWNNLSGSVPSSFFTPGPWQLADVLLDSNPLLIFPTATAPATIQFGLAAAVRNSVPVRIIFIMDGLLALFDAGCLYAFLRSRRKKEKNVIIPICDISDPSIEYTVTLDDLRRITRNFHDDNIIGRGARSIVYKGIVGGGQVAVKVLKMENPEKSRETLLRELQTLGRVRHRNLLRILAVCSDIETRALVLEFMPFSSLDHFLYKMVGRACLSWDTRFNILVGVAQGLVHLHREHQEPIIHCDLKPTNILLDSDFEPKVADFGIAKYVYPGCSRDESISGLCGTIGYIPPENGWTSSVSTKGDVFSFGIVLLEILTARKPYEGWDVEQGQPQSLVEFAASAYPNNVMTILDPNLSMLELDGDLHQPEVRQVLKIGLKCTEVLPRNRPDMIDVLNMLTEIKVLRRTSTARRKYPGVDHLSQLPTLWEFPHDPASRILQGSQETNLELWIARRMP